MKNHELGGRDARTNIYKTQPLRRLSFLLRILHVLFAEITQGSCIIPRRQQKAMKTATRIFGLSADNINFCLNDLGRICDDLGRLQIRAFAEDDRDALKFIMKFNEDNNVIHRRYLEFEAQKRAFKKRLQELRKAIEKERRGDAGGGGRGEERFGLRDEDEEPREETKERAVEHEEEPPAEPVFDNIDDAFNNPTWGRGSGTGRRRSQPAVVIGNPDGASSRENPRYVPTYVGKGIAFDNPRESDSD